MCYCCPCVLYDVRIFISMRLKQRYMVSRRSCLMLYKRPPNTVICCSSFRGIFLLCLSGRPSLLQLLVYGKYECRTGYRSCDCDAASTVHAFDTVLLPKRFSYSAERRLSTSQLLDIFRLHSRLDGIGRIEHEVIGSTCDGTRGHALPDWKIFLRGRSTRALEEDLHAFVPTKPCCTASCLADQGSKLSVPVASKALVTIDRSNDTSYGRCGYDVAVRF